MITKTRVSIYETNSSSMHSLTFCPADTSKLPLNTLETHIILGSGEYGWGYDTLTTTLEKMDYLAVGAAGDKTKTDMLLDAIHQIYPEIYIEFSDNGYIDHQSYGEVWNELGTVNEIIQMLVGNSTIEIDNDNH